MAIWSALLTGASGLTAYGDAISVVGDNIANVSTTGFRASRANFRDLLGGFSTNGQRSGFGVHMSGPEVLHNEGSLIGTDKPMDMAIQGRGFFVLQGALRGVQGQYFSRDGRFGFDDEDKIVNAYGLRLQGYAIDQQTGVMNSRLDDVSVARQSPPATTGSVDLHVQLDGGAPVLNNPWDPNDPAGTSNFNSAVTVYDSLGGAHQVNVYFRQEGNGLWDVHMMVDGADVVGGVAGTEVEIASGNLTYTQDGELDTEAIASVGVDFVGATPGQIIDFDFGDAIQNDNGTGLAGSTQFNDDFSVLSSSQDGYAAGALIDLQISDEGIITALFNNGDSRDVARVALADFASNPALTRAGNQLFTQTKESGEPRISAAATGRRGSIASAALEGSNVDLGGELVTLISYQRAFQANARTVTTADEMLAETMNIKR